MGSLPVPALSGNYCRTIGLVCDSRTRRASSIFVRSSGVPLARFPSDADMVCGGASLCNEPNIPMGSCRSGRWYYIKVLDGVVRARSASHSRRWASRRIASGRCRLGNWAACPPEAEAGIARDTATPAPIKVVLRPVGAGVSLYRVLLRQQLDVTDGIRPPNERAA